ncbi:DUF721 domain-containing protein [Massilia solisilvae]|uniref:DUF721 domain-containing protein n=1 Tax=Massilia solisilvae TaxID=1811225 RepID=A0ABT2BQ28_9BURK|nr:DUF721 domain-containing protein [Massilia solisilvae]MCS0610616.1 DUF721 domain-containing protein [Massilia solisilvae]
MQFSHNARPVHIYGTRTHKTSFGATEFLRANDRMAALLPAAMRMARLQSDCAALLPAMFSACDVLSFQEGALVLAVPSSALAARLKQQTLKLQNGLQQRGWQVDSIKLKVQVTRPVPEQMKMRTLELPPTAVQAFEDLGDALPQTAQNADLIAAIRSLAAKRKQQG